MTKYFGHAYLAMNNKNEMFSFFKGIFDNGQKPEDMWYPTVKELNSWESNQMQVNTTTTTKATCEKNKPGNVISLVSGTLAFYPNVLNNGRVSGKFWPVNYGDVGTWSVGVTRGNYTYIFNSSEGRKSGWISKHYIDKVIKCSG